MLTRCSEVLLSRAIHSHALPTTAAHVHHLFWAKIFSLPLHALIRTWWAVEFPRTSCFRGYFAVWGITGATCLRALQLYNRGIFTCVQKFACPVFSRLNIAPRSYWKWRVLQQEKGEGKAMLKLSEGAVVTAMSQ